MQIEKKEAVLQKEFTSINKQINKIPNKLTQKVTFTFLYVTSSNCNQHFTTASIHLSIYAEQKIRLNQK